MTLRECNYDIGVSAIYATLLILQDAVVFAEINWSFKRIVAAAAVSAQPPRPGTGYYH